ncbi:alpha/beta hydrolase [Nonomuraea roseoviolacea]|uniref:Acetyl esterase/lipase n=1 Tax=Nonomuraea roseoviolacea subsp. carminata TaxID=160689 RepID=A0ABT1KDD9_9ACTN|nr:alpha/beta hydrolase [Nonomuraea roseoviolacea]MCP2352038.1 acetyl esterase/lipase [Nonomuraea roseoviolacea subsp. carminata]
MSGHRLWPGEPGERITAYPVPSKRPAPAVVVLPGGGYTRLAEHENEPVARWLNTLGIAAFALHYRVAPHRHPLPLLDAARAVRWVRAHATDHGVDPERVGVLGFSAGGHLAGLLATETGPALAEGPHDEVDAQEARPDLAVLCYPVVTLTGPAAHAGSVAALLGPGQEAGDPAELSIERRVGPRTPPVFVWHTADDASVPVDNALLLTSALARHGVPVEAHVYPNGAHGLGLAVGDPVVGDWTSRCAVFLRSHGFTG